MGPSGSISVPRQCLIVSPYFPPSTLAGVHRARHLAKHLPAAGWSPTIVCVDERFHEERLDPGLSGLVPDSVRVIKTSAASQKWARRIGLGDISLRAFFQIRSEVFRLLSEGNIDVCLITGSPYYPMLLAGEIDRRFGVPVVLDFQDPWASTWGATQPLFSKGGVSHRLSVALEPMALSGASYVTTVSEIQNAQLRERYPWLDERRMSAHPIGADRDDFLALDQAASEQRNITLDHSKINLSYVGNVWPGAKQSLQVFLAAVSRFAAGRPDLAAKLQINFVGTSNQPNEFDRLSVMPLAEVAGVNQLVREVPQRVPYLEALYLVSNSDYLLMFGSLEPHYTASKIYANLMTDRPYISLFHRESSAHEILRAAGGGVNFGFSSLAELKLLEQDICAGLERLIDAPGSLGLVDPASYRAFEAHSIAQRYGEIFDLLQVGRGRT